MATKKAFRVKNGLDVNGAATVSSTATITGDLTASANLNVTEHLAVTNTATFSNTIGVTGGATFSNSVAVTGATTFSNAVTIETQVDQALTITSTDPGGAGEPIVSLYRNSASPAPDDVLGYYKFQGENSADELTDYAYIISTIADETDATEDGRLLFYTMRDGAISDANLVVIEHGMYYNGVTGGDKGNNSINFGSIYQDGVKIPKNNLDGDSIPTTTDDSSAGYSNGSIWVDSGNTFYICVDATPSAAIWSSGGGGGDVIITDDTSSDKELYVLSANTDDSLYTSSTDFTYNPSTGTVTAVDYVSTSDERLKENIEIIDDALNIVNNMNGHSYDWKETGKHSYGVIAQELEQIVPELVDEGPNGYKRVHYLGIIGFLIESIKTLSARVEELENK